MRKGEQERTVAALITEVDRQLLNHWIQESNQKDFLEVLELLKDDQGWQILFKDLRLSTKEYFRNIQNSNSLAYSKLLRSFMLIREFKSQNNDQVSQLYDEEIQKLNKSSSKLCQQCTLEMVKNLKNYLNSQKKILTLEKKNDKHYEKVFSLRTKYFLGVGVGFAALDGLLYYLSLFHPIILGVQSCIACYFGYSTIYHSCKIVKTIGQIYCQFCNQMCCICCCCPYNCFNYCRCCCCKKQCQECRI